MSSYDLHKGIVKTAILHLTEEEAKEEKIIPTMYGWKFFDPEVDPRMLVHLDEKNNEGLDLRIERFPREAPTQFIEAALVPGAEDVSARSLAILFLALYGQKE